LTTGSHPVIVRDAGLCTFIVPVSITLPVAAVTAAETRVNVLCFGNATGSATVTATAGTGTAPYEYSIDGGTTWQASGTFNNLTAERKCVVVRKSGPRSTYVNITINKQIRTLTVARSHVKLICSG